MSAIACFRQLSCLLSVCHCLGGCLDVVSCSSADCPLAESAASILAGGNRTLPDVVAKMDESMIQHAMESKDPSAGERALREYDVAIEESSESLEKAKLLLGKAVLCGMFSWFEQSRDALESARMLTPDNLDMRLELVFPSTASRPAYQKVPSQRGAQLSRPAGLPPSFALLAFKPVCPRSVSGQLCA
jgi:hypothetical protein